MLAGCVRPGPDSVRQQVGALYQSLRECEIAYINSVASYGTAAGTVTQRARRPREALALKSANCIDGSVLFASLLEGAFLSPVLLLIPGHALVRRESDDGAGDWQFLETTMIGTHDFEPVCASGQKQYQQARNFYPETLRPHRLAELRERGVWPME